MSRRLGETLVEAGKITEAQLHRALTAQLVFGGHLGTSLLELGYLDEETLGETLSAMFGVPYADFDLLSRVPYSVIRSLPAKLVEKHKVVPLRLEGKTLHLAMIDPKNLLALDEISFVTGYRIVPWVSPEVRLLQVLEKYYNLPRTQRHIALSRELSRLRSPREKLQPLEGDEVAPDSEARPQQSAPRVTAAAAGSAGPASPAPPAGVPIPRASAPAEPVVDHWEKYGYGRSWREVADAIEGEASLGEVRTPEADTRPQPRTGPGAPAPSRVAPAPSLLESSRRLAEAESVEEIVSITLDHFVSRLPRTIFFVVKEGRAVGWAGRGDGLSERAVKSLALPLAEPGSLFSLVGEGKTHYLGPFPKSRAAGGLHAQLGLRAPRAILVVPIAVKGRVTAYLYADGGEGEILDLEVPASLSLCARAGLALQIVILHNKILAS